MNESRFQSYLSDAESFSNFVVAQLERIFDGAEVFVFLREQGTKASLHFCLRDSEPKHFRVFSVVRVPPKNIKEDEFESRAKVHLSKSNRIPFRALDWTLVRSLVSDKFLSTRQRYDSLQADVNTAPETLQEKLDRLGKGLVKRFSPLATSLDERYQLVDEDSFLVGECYPVYPASLVDSYHEKLLLESNRREDLQIAIDVLKEKYQERSALIWAELEKVKPLVRDNEEIKRAINELRSELDGGVEFKFRVRYTV